MSKKFVVDTHAILWFIAKDNKLSSGAHSILVQAEQEKVEIFVSTIVFAELLYICEKGKAPVPLETIIKNLISNKGFTVVPFDFSIFEKMLILPKELDIHDRIIAATAKLYNARIISKDHILNQTPGIETVW